MFFKENLHIPMLAFSLAILPTSHPLGPNVPRAIDASHLSFWSKPTLIGCLPPTLWSWYCQQLHGPHTATWEAFVCHSQWLHSRGCHTSFFLGSSPCFGILHWPEGQLLPGPSSGDRCYGHCSPQSSSPYLYSHRDLSQSRGSNQIHQAADSKIHPCNRSARATEAGGLHV